MEHNMQLSNKELLLASVLMVISPSTGSVESSVNKELHTTLDQEKRVSPKAYTKIYTIDGQGEILLDTLSLGGGVMQRKVSELQQTPLYMSGTRKHIGEYLGYDQYDYILKKYNNDTMTDSLKTAEQLNINNFQIIRCPLIYDELAHLVPNDLSTLLQDPKFEAYRESLHAQDTVIVIYQQPNGQYALCYYESGILRLATYATLGRGTSTPRGLFTPDYTVKNKRSRKYRNAPMPYAIHVINNIFIHQGKVSTQERSHGCMRIPGLYAEALYNFVNVPTLTMIYKEQQGLLTETELQTLAQLKTKVPQVLVVD